MKNRTSCPTCLDPSQRHTVETILQKVNSLWTESIKQYEAHDALPYYSGRYDAITEIRELLNKMLVGGDSIPDAAYPEQPEPDGFTTLGDMMEPGDPGHQESLSQTIDRITRNREVKLCSLVSNQMVSAIA